VTRIGTVTSALPREWLTQAANQVKWPIKKARMATRMI
jgi:hypothetical protein